MCHYRQSSLSDTKADAERQAREAKRNETVDKIRTDAGKAAEKAVPARESVTAK